MTQTELDARLAHYQNAYAIGKITLGELHAFIDALRLLMEEDWLD